MSDTYFSVGNVQSFSQLCKILVDMDRLKTTAVGSQTFVQRDSVTLSHSHTYTDKTLGINVTQTLHMSAVNALQVITIKSKLLLM